VDVEAGLPGVFRAPIQVVRALPEAFCALVHVVAALSEVVRALREVEDDDGRLAGGERQQELLELPPLDLATLLLALPPQPSGDTGDRGATEYRRSCTDN
jgi:hypothetical protein